MINASVRKQTLIDNNSIGYAEDYINLGQSISFRSSTNEEVVRRYALAWRKFWALERTLKIKIPLRLKAKVTVGRILPSLLYGAIWALSKKSSMATGHLSEK